MAKQNSNNEKGKQVEINNVGADVEFNRRPLRKDELMHSHEWSSSGGKVPDIARMEGRPHKVKGE